MEFRLTYNGEIKTSADSTFKHELREIFHPQIKDLWTYPPLKYIEDMCSGNEFIDNFTKNINNFNFAFIVGQKIGVFVEIDVLMLVPSSPARLIYNGDIDNRLKTLFDALRCPKNYNEIPSGKSPSQEQQPFFYCLIEDDSLITSVKVTYDRLLDPKNPRDVFLILNVKTKDIEGTRLGSAIGSL
jgi:hypothetical protein